MIKIQHGGFLIYICQPTFMISFYCYNHCMTGRYCQVFLYIQKVLGIVMLEDGLTKIFLRSFILMHVIGEMSRVQPNSR